MIGGVGIAEFEGLPNCAELQKLYLCDGEKGKGYGKLLMQAAADFARSAGYKCLYLETHTNLEAAIGLYEKMGFEKIGTFAKFMCVDGVFYDAYLMNLYL